MSTEQKGEGFFFAQPQAKPWFNFNVYQNSGREETEKELRVKRLHTAQRWEKAGTEASLSACLDDSFGPVPGM